MDSRVFYAAQNGDRGEIERLYREKPELLGEVTINRRTVLHIAARGRHLDFLTWVVENVPASTMPVSWFPYFQRLLGSLIPPTLAFLMRNVFWWEILNGIKCSAMCVAQDSDGNTPLHEAARGGNVDLVDYIIQVAETEIGINLLHLLEDKNDFGETPLRIACKCGHEDVASYLLNASRAFNIMMELYICLHLAAYGGHVGVVRLLLDNNNMETFGEVWMMQDYHGATPLHAAIYGGHLDIVQEILNPEILNPDLGSDWRNWLITKQDSNGNCGIHVAILKERYYIVDCLISSSPDCIEIRNADGNTALHLGAQNAKSPQFVEYLLSFPGVNVNAENEERLTALDIARAEASKIFANENISIHGKDRAEASRNSINVIISILEKKGASGSYRQEFMKVKGSLSLQTEAKENEVMNVETLVASLVATVTFAAIFQVPGGIQDDENSIQYQAATLAFHSSFSYFLFFDTLALFTSLFVVIAWILCKRLKGRSAKYKAVFMSLTAPLLGISVVSTAMAFVNATSLVTIPPNVKGLRTTNKEAFHKYQTLTLLVFFASTIPVFCMIYLYPFMFEGAALGSFKNAAQLWSRVKLYFLHSRKFEMAVFMCYFFIGFQLYQTIMPLK